MPTEIAPVVPYREGQHESTSHYKAHDLESSDDKDSNAEEYDKIESDLTPFFHFDVVSAVRAAESGLQWRHSSLSTDKKFDVKTDGQLVSESD